MASSSITSMLSSGADVPGTRTPGFSITVSGGGAGSGGLGGVLGAVASALGAGGGSDPWKEHVTRISLKRGCASRIDTLEVELLDDDSTPRAAIGDTFGLSLGFSDSGVSGVFLGNVQSSGNNTVGRKRIGVVNAGAALAAIRLNQAYDSVKCGDIVNDLLSKAGVSAGTVEDGIAFQSYVVDDRMNAWVHIARLAALCGFWAFCGRDGKVHFKNICPGSPAKTLIFGVDTVSVDRLETAGYLPTWEVVGEGAASKKGKNAWYWPVKDVSALRAKVRDGGGRALYVGSLRDSASVNQAGRALASHDERSSVRGIVRMTGDPTLEIGDTIELASFPRGHVNGSVLVSEISHRYTKWGGFITDIGFCRAAGGL